MSRIKFRANERDLGMVSKSRGHLALACCVIVIWFSFHWCFTAVGFHLHRLHNVGVLVGNTEEPPLSGSSPSSNWQRMFYQAGYIGDFKRIELNVNATYVTVYSISDLDEDGNPKPGVLTLSEVEVYGTPKGRNRQAVNKRSIPFVRRPHHYGGRCGVTWMRLFFTGYVLCPRAFYSPPKDLPTQCGWQITSEFEWIVLNGLDLTNLNHGFMK